MRYIKYIFIISVLVADFSKAGTAQVVNRFENFDGTFKIANGKKITFPEDFNGKPSVFIFLSPECPLCINYIRIISDLMKSYKGQVKFYAVFSGKYIKVKEVNTFAKKYSLMFPMIMDPDYKISRNTQARVTPECVLMDSSGVVKYKGAIDDRATAPGKFRNSANMNFLHDAIQSLLSGKSISIQETNAVGCFIEY